MQADGDGVLRAWQTKKETTVNLNLKARNKTQLMSVFMMCLCVLEQRLRTARSEVL